MRTRLVLLVTAALVVVSLFGTACSPKEAAAPPTRHLLIVGSVMASATYAVSAGYANVINVKVPGVSVAVQESSGAVSGMEAVAQGKGDIVSTNSLSIWQQQNAVGAFAGKPPFKKLLGWTPSKMNKLKFVVLASSPAKTLSDPMTVKMNFAPPGSNSRVDCDSVMDALGYTPQQRDQRGLAEAVQAMKNGEIVGFTTDGPDPDPSVMDVITAKPVRIIELSEAEMDKVMAKYPFYVKAVTPANTYKGIDKDTRVLGMSTAFMINADLPDDLVYQMTKVICEALPELAKSIPGAAGYGPKDILDMPFQIHPGAVKYYEEIGLKLSPVQRGK